MFFVVGSLHITSMPFEFISVCVIFCFRGRFSCPSAELFNCYLRLSLRQQSHLAKLLAASLLKLLRALYPRSSVVDNFSFHFHTDYRVEAFVLFQTENDRIAAAKAFQSCE